MSSELFASPLNCRFPRFCSAALDADAPFGSLGSFFDCDLRSGTPPPATPPRRRATRRRATRRRAARHPLLHDSLRTLLRLARAAYPSAGGRWACARAPLQRELHAELSAVGGGGGRADAHELEPDRGLCSV